VSDSLGNAIPREQARVREVLAAYKEIGPSGAFGAMMIERDLAAMDRAVISGDIAEMIRCYQVLKGIEA
jgi:hypothetical protein